MKNVLLLIITLSIPFYVFSQDLIIKSNGDKLDCKILKEDSLKLYFAFRKNGYNINTFISKNEIRSYSYKYRQNGNFFKDSIDNKSDKKNAITIGILEGGGSLVGADLETLLGSQFGVQIGAGLVGFGAGLDVHLHSSIRSSFISFQYWHQGFGSSYTQSVVGPSFVYRGKKWFTFQIGFGFPVGRGPALPVDTKQSPVMLTYAIGAYIPF